MTEKCARKALIGCFLSVMATAAPCRAITVATIGDSFADSLYNSLRARPDLLQRYDVHLNRWSRPSVGLTRTDYFDYAAWLRDSEELGAVDLCFVEIGSNDMQSIPVAKDQWIAHGSLQWKEAYAGRTFELARILTERRSGEPGGVREGRLKLNERLETLSLVASTTVRGGPSGPRTRFPAGPAG
jgi:hypothetical protein